MSCENGYFPTSRLSDLLLRVDENEIFNPNGITPDRLNLDNLQGTISLLKGIDGNQIQTDDSGLFYDAEGNLLQSVEADFQDGKISPDSAAGFGQTSEIFSQIQSFAENVDLTSANSEYGVDTIVNLTNSLNDFLSSFDGLEDYPSLDYRLSGLPVLSNTEVGLFINDSSLDPNDLINAISNFNGGGGGGGGGGGSVENSFPISTMLNGLESFYTVNIGKDIAAGICAKVASIIQKILGIIVIIDTAKEILATLKALSEKDPYKLLEQLLAYLTVEAIWAAIKAAIEKIFEIIRRKILALIERFKKMICSLIGTAQRALTQLNGKCIDVEDFYSEENQKTFLERIEAFITKVSSEFERLTLENVALLLAKFCEFVTLLQQLLFAPFLAFQEFGNTIKAENQMMRSVSLKNTKIAVAYGALRLSPEDRKALIEVARVENNAKSLPIDELIEGGSTDYVTAKEVTCEEALELFCLKPEGVPGKFSFSGQPLEGKPQYYKFVKPIVYARLMRMSVRLGKQFTIIKGFDPKPDDEKLGSSQNSIMASGCAIHIQAGGSYQELAEIIVSASQEGFVGIGIHGGYVHLDIGPRKLTWISGYSPGFKDTSAQITDTPLAASLAYLLERHERREFTRKQI